MRILAVILMTMLFSSIQAQSIFGTWLTGKGEAKIEIYETPNGTIEGTLVWVEESDEKGKKLLGTKIVQDVIKIGANKFEGKVFNPNNGNLYNATIHLISQSTMNLRGYIGISLFGKTEKWNKVSD